MSEFRVSVGKEALGFSAAHFITFGHGGCESLHGHNYRVGVTLTGVLDRHSMVYDFIALSRDMKVLLGEMDHRLLLPESNPDLVLEIADGEVEVHHASRRYVFPASDVVVLPVPNTTAEMLAEYLGRRLARCLDEARTEGISGLRVEVEETSGQSAAWAGAYHS